MIDLPIGTVFLLPHEKGKKVKIKVVESNYCCDCILLQNELCNYLSCSAQTREDNTNVVFKGVKK